MSSLTLSSHMWPDGDNGDNGERRGKKENRSFNLVRIFKATFEQRNDNCRRKCLDSFTILMYLYFNLGPKSLGIVCKKECVTITRPTARAPWGLMWLPGTIMIEKAETSPKPHLPQSYPPPLTGFAFKFENRLVRGSHSIAKCEIQLGAAAVPPHWGMMV